MKVINTELNIKDNESINQCQRNNIANLEECKINDRKNQSQTSTNNKRDRIF